jgi:demethylmenaquinone methyltransferase / 2-methoxy-6-polyprenyl-1,4-benzoquinol methylase
MNDNSTTHFGFSQVKTEEKQAKVAEVFHSVANKYDLMNDVMSMGVHHLWKKFTIELCGLRDGHVVLDLAGGTGDLAIKQAKLVGDSGHVVLADINASMLQEGRDRVLNKGLVNRISTTSAMPKSCLLKIIASIALPSLLDCAM